MQETARTNIAVLVLRLGIGLTAMFYGSQKLLGVFGGEGIHGTVAFMKDQLGIPPVFALLAMVAEFFGGLGMLVGFFTSIAAFGFACTMAVATFESWKDPQFAGNLFTHGTPQLASQAFYTPALFCGAVAIMMIGGGDFSLDAKVFKKKAKSRVKKSK
jgi:putative oxidoreductase